MKKINFKNLSVDEVLSKGELRKVIGGNGSNQWPEVYYCACLTNDGLESDWYTVESAQEKNDLIIYMDQHCLGYNCTLTN